MKGTNMRESVELLLELAEVLLRDNPVLQKQVRELLKKHLSEGES
jgi:hypothetical protein